ncbi:hypothetical protein J14TS2_05260 [Bacillus sp. J14TS2]|uniref:YphA family membrane protein n=1 Tax=Bacillus sp. J14TS2 TaxID=2807188 RepID=UPI001B253486|nr:hypothetical protein [Bacillus sp. J14TS2]GIN70051.1 hypothetical protein J14TS2_05260 [Bacillus sp. J14TS2]
MAGSIFLLFIWVIWIFATFLMDKQEVHRWTIAIFALVMIICLPIKLSLNGFMISGQSLVVLITCYLIMVKLSFKKQVVLLIAVVSLILGYTGARLFELFDPILMIVDRKILLSFILIVVSYIVYPFNFLERALFICLGVLQGDFLLAIILSKWEIPYVIGSLEILDILSITIFTMIISYIFSKILVLMRVNKNKKVLH